MGDLFHFQVVDDSDVVMEYSSSLGWVVVNKSLSAATMKCDICGNTRELAVGGW